MNIRRIKIRNQIKHSLITLFFPQRPARSARQRRRTKPATSLTRIQAGMPQLDPDPARATRARRSHRISPTYTRGGYLAGSRRDPRIRQPLFRVG